MSEDPGHKAMLYFLEVLMNSNEPLTISQMAGRFGSPSFTAEMRCAAGRNEVGLKKFLLKCPSLFTVNGNMVSLFDSSKTVSSPPSTEGSSAGGGETPSSRRLPDVSSEMEAVRYFQNKMNEKDENWIPIRSLAGHLSQASATVRNVVGPQLEFKKWLLKHEHIFEVQGELVGLQNGLAAMAVPNLPCSTFDHIHNGDISPLITPGMAVSRHRNDPVAMTAEASACQPKVAPDKLPAPAPMSAIVTKLLIIPKPEAAPARAKPSSPVKETCIVPVPVASAVSQPNEERTTTIPLPCPVKTRNADPSITVEATSKTTPKEKVASLVPIPEQKCFVSVACQTISTGEIISGQLYQE